MYSKISFNANMIDNRRVTIKRGFFSLSVIIDLLVHCELDMKVFLILNQLN